MKNYLYLTILLLAGTSGLKAQSGIDRILQSIAVNNKTLQAGSRLTDAQKLEARTGIFLPNPTVELNQLWAEGSAGGNINELAVVQSFDFPSVYSHKNKLARLKSSNYEQQFAITRQQVLLNAKQICLEIIYLRKQEELLGERLGNAEKLLALYQKRLEEGDANQLELNKIQLERLNAQNAARLNRTALTTALEKLENLNGGLPIEFPDRDYPQTGRLPEAGQLEKEYMAAGPSLKDHAGQAEISGREIRLMQAQSLPKFDLGYRRNGGSDEKLNGFRIGMSIPLWENRNTVKKAKAQYEYTHAVIDDNTRTLKSTLRQLYQQAEALQASCTEYNRILSGQRNIELLNKALAAGQISMIDYFIEVTTLYDSQQNFLDVERDYYNTLAQLLQYQL